jgi:hypothetical protein
VPISFTKWRKPDDVPHTLFQIAQDHYVGARLCLVGGAAFPAQLAMQQCIETGAKALIMSATPARRFRGQAGHRLRELLGEASTTNPRLATLLTNRDVGAVLSVLEKGYNEIRYGEGVLGMDLGGTLNAFDTIAWRLLSEVGVTLKYERPLALRVAECVLPVFLWRLKLPVIEVLHSTETGEAAEWAAAEVVVGPPSQSG